MKKNIEYIDIENLNDLPRISSKKRYLEFLGGTKKYRCFIVDKNYSRYKFYNEHLDLIDKILHPIYNNREIMVVQDNTYPIPGFYIVSYTKNYNNIAQLPDSLIMRTSNIIKYIRKIMNEKLKIKLVDIHYEEKNKETSNVHYWIIPKYKEVTDMKSYFDTFDYHKTKREILKYNNILRKELLRINYKKIDDELYNKIEMKEKKINLCIGKKCFMTCKGCYNNFCKQGEISYKEIIIFLKYAKSRGLEKITLSGGDPLTRKDIKKIIQKSSKLNLKINLDTVGLTFTKARIIPSTKEKINKFNNVNILKKLNSIGIPLDGSNNDIVSKFRIYKGNLFNEIMEVLNLFDQLNINICINTVLHKGNLYDIENIYNILIQHKCVKNWQIFQFMPIGILGNKNANLYKINQKDFINTKNKIIRLNKNNSIIIDFKSAEERSYNYMLVNSNGEAYKVNLENKIERFGSIKDHTTWNNIINNLL